MSYSEALSSSVSTVKDCMRAHAGKYPSAVLIAAASCDDLFLPSFEIISSEGSPDGDFTALTRRLRRVLEGYAEAPFMERFDPELLPALVFGVGCDKYMLGFVVVLLHYSEAPVGDHFEEQLITALEISSSINKTIEEQRPARADEDVPRVRFACGSLFSTEEQSVFTVSLPAGERLSLF